MPRKKRSTVNAKAKGNKKNNKLAAATRTFSDEDSHNTDPTEDKKEDMKQEVNLQIALTTGRSRRAATAARKSYAEQDSDTATDDSSEEEDFTGSAENKKARNKKRNKAALTSPASKKRRKSTASTPLTDIKNKIASKIVGSTTKKAAQTTPSIKELTSDMWEPNKEDWRCVGAMDY